jgi:putative tryptophan/tyrosine transport system substrate-binding protein
MCLAKLLALGDRGNRMNRRASITLLGGAAAAWPLAARAQQAAMPVIGFLGGSSLAERRPLLVTFRQALAEAGFVEGQNVATEYRWAEGQYDRARAGGGPGPPRSRRGFRRRRPVRAGGEGRDQHGSNCLQHGHRAGPGRSGLQPQSPGWQPDWCQLDCWPLPAKQLGLLHELAPAAKTIAVLINPNNANAERDAATVQEAGRAIGVQILVMRATAEMDFETVFATLARERAGGLLVNSDVFFTSRRDQLVGRASRQALPLMSAWREFPLAGGLISYGPSLAAAYRQIGTYTAKILNGARPADLPVVQPTAFELVINLKTAKALGLECRRRCSPAPTR